MQKIKDILLAGALGDSFGYQIEFDSIEKIKKRFGQTGLRRFLNDKIIASDDTQMSIFAMQAIVSCQEENIRDPVQILSRIEEYEHIHQEKNNIIRKLDK